MLEHIYLKGCFEEDWFTYPNVYLAMVENCRPDGTLVEVGAWKGRSSSFLVVEAKNKSKDISVHIVDTWLGSPEHTEEMKDGLYEKFIANMSPLSGHYIAHRKNSLEACEQFSDGTLDGVFIDADHSYESVLADIKAWLPKVRSGGILAGHDYFSTYLGVVQAVNISFDSFQVIEGCWIHKC